MGTPLEPFLFTDVNGRPWGVRIVLKGGRYGRDNCLTNDGEEPLVEFWDRHYAGRKSPWGGPAFPAEGQFVSRYLVSQLQRRPHHALCLHGGVPAWTVDADSMARVVAWMTEQLGGEG